MQEQESLDKQETLVHTPAPSSAEKTIPAILCVTVVCNMPIYAFIDLQTPNFSDGSDSLLFFLVAIITVGIPLTAILIIKVTSAAARGLKSDDLVPFKSIISALFKYVLIYITSLVFVPMLIIFSTQVVGRLLGLNLQG